MGRRLRPRHPRQGPPSLGTQWGQGTSGPCGVRGSAPRFANPWSLNFQLTTLMTKEHALVAHGELHPWLAAQALQARCPGPALLHDDQAVEEALALDAFDGAGGDEALD